MSTNISRIVFYLFLVIVGTFILNTRLPEPGSGPRSELASFSDETTFTTIWAHLQKSRQAEYRGDYLRDISLGRAKSVYKTARSNCQAAQEINPEPGFLKRTISEHCERINNKLKRLRK